MKTSLNQQELAQLLSHKLHHESLSDELADRCELAESWNRPIGALTYLLARVLEARNADGRQESIDRIELFYNLPDTMYVEIQEMDHRFVSHLIRNLRQLETLEDELVELHTNMLDHDYIRFVRY